MQPKLLANQGLSYRCAHLMIFFKVSDQKQNEVDEFKWFFLLMDLDRKWFEPSGPQKDHDAVEDLSFLRGGGGWWKWGTVLLGPEGYLSKSARRWWGTQTLLLASAVSLNKDNTYSDKLCCMRTQNLTDAATLRKIAALGSLGLDKYPGALGAMRQLCAACPRELVFV